MPLGSPTQVSCLEYLCQVTNMARPTLAQGDGSKWPKYGNCLVNAYVTTELLYEKREKEA